MKKITLLIFLFTICNLGLQASFPVNKMNVEVANAEVESLIDLKESKTIKPANLTVSADKALSPAIADKESTGLIVSLLLWFFLGILAAHRWYNSKPVIWNLLFILTLGGLGIWWLVDGVSIITNKF